jgi:hypothetical protein
MTRVRNLQILYGGVKEAQKRLQDATEYLDLAILNCENHIPAEDRHSRLRLAARSYSTAAHELTTAVSRLDRFLLEGAAAEPRKAMSVRNGERLTFHSACKSA